MQWTDSWIAECPEFFICSLTENFPLPKLRSLGLVGKQKQLRSGLFLLPLRQRATAQYLTMVHAKMNCKGQKKTREFPIYQTHMAFLAVCLFSLYSRSIPRSLASVLKFRYQSLTLKYIEIGLFRLRFFFRSATVCNSLINTHARRFYWWAHGMV